MKIAMIGQRGVPAECGGIDTSVEQLSLRLARRGHDVTVFCRHKSSVSKARKMSGIKVEYLPCIQSRILETLSHGLICSVYASLHGYDIVHFHGMGSALFSGIPRFFRKKTVVTIQGLDWKRKKWGLIIKKGLKLCEWAALNFPNKTVVVSRTLREYYMSRRGESLTYIPNAGDCSGQEEAASSGWLDNLGVRKNEYILFLGRLVPEKGCHYLIRAFKGLKTDKKLVIAGGSSYTDKYALELKKAAEGDGRIMFTGPLYGGVKRELLKGAYIFVLPSEIEGMSISLLEAMNYGRCVLVSDIPENIEAAGGCGFSFRRKDEADLREKLSYLFSEPGLAQEAGRLAALRVKKDYSWQAAAEKTEQLYFLTRRHA